MHGRNRFWWAALPLLAVGLLLTACGDDGGAASGEPVSWSAQAIEDSRAGIPIDPVQVNSNLGAGLNRFALGLFDKDTQAPLSGATVQMKVYQLAEDPNEEPEVSTLLDEYTLEPRSLKPTTDHVHADGTVHEHTGELVTIYTAMETYPAEGWYGAEVDFETPEGNRYEDVRFRFFVQEHTSEPAVGDPVPPSEQLTVADVDDVAAIDSSATPRPELHDTTVAEALEAGEPFLVAFVTPAFCQTRFCGPVLEDAVMPVQEQFGDRIEVMHVEPYDLEQARTGSPLVPIEMTREWGLLSEPFIFVVGADGKVAAKFEGIIEADELITAVEQVLGDAPAAAAATASPTPAAAGAASGY